MQETILLNVPLDDFKLLIIDAMHSCMQGGGVNQNAINTKHEIIDRSELCKRLDITEPTAIRWEKKGAIPCFRIGSNVRYNWHNVIASLESKRRVA